MRGIWIESLCYFKFIQFRRERGSSTEVSMDSNPLVSVTVLCDNKEFMLYFHFMFFYESPFVFWHLPLRIMLSNSFIIIIVVVVICLFNTRIRNIRCYYLLLYISKILQSFSKSSDLVGMPEQKDLHKFLVCIVILLYSGISKNWC